MLLLLVFVSDSFGSESATGVGSYERIKKMELLISLTFFSFLFFVLGLVSDYFTGRSER